MIFRLTILVLLSLQAFSSDEIIGSISRGEAFWVDKVYPLASKVNLEPEFVKILKKKSDYCFVCRDVDSFKHAYSYMYTKGHQLKSATQEDRIVASNFLYVYDQFSGTSLGSFFEDGRIIDPLKFANYSIHYLHHLRESFLLKTNYGGNITLPLLGIKFIKPTKHDILSTREENGISVYKIRVYLELFFPKGFGFDVSKELASISSGRDQELSFLKKSLLAFEVETSSRPVFKDKGIIELTGGFLGQGKWVAPENGERKIYPVYVLSMSPEFSMNKSIPHSFEKEILRSSNKIDDPSFTNKYLITDFKFKVGPSWRNLISEGQLTELMKKFIKVRMEFLFQREKQMVIIDQNSLTFRNGYLEGSMMVLGEYNHEQISYALDDADLESIIYF